MNNNIIYIKNIIRDKLLSILINYLIYIYIANK